MSEMKGSTKRIIILKKRKIDTNVTPSKISFTDVSFSGAVQNDSNYESVGVEATVPPESVLIGNLSTPAQVSHLSELLREELRVVCDKIVKISGWNALRDWCEEILASFSFDDGNPVVTLDYANQNFQESALLEECVDDNQFTHAKDNQQVSISCSQESTDNMSDNNYCSAVASAHDDNVESSVNYTLDQQEPTCCNISDGYSQGDALVVETSVVEPSVRNPRNLLSATHIRDYIDPEDNSVVDMADVIVLQYGEDIETEDVDILGDEDDQFNEDSKINVLIPFYSDEINDQINDVIKPEETDNVFKICENVLRPKISGSARNQIFSGSRGFNPDKPYHCAECDKSYKRLTELQLHRKSHTGELQTICSVCGKTFSRLESLKRHQSIHNKQKFCCELCDKTFASKEGRIRHVKNTHKIEESPFICTQCGKKCCSGYELKKHEIWCRGDRPFGCSHCGKRFAAAGNLRTHEMIHTGERPYGCTQCDRRFVSSSYVKVHVRQVHTNERPFKCLKCDKAFAVPQVLKLHQLVHSGVRPYTCTQCGKKLSSRSAFKGHQAMHLRAASGVTTTHTRQVLKRTTREVDRLNL